MATPVPTPLPTSARTPIRRSTPPRPTTVTAHTPYNPLVGGMPSLAFLQNTANQHAAADTKAALAALPTVDDIRGLASGLSSLQAANEAHLAQQASSAGGAYNQAFNSAINPSNAAMIAAGGHAGAPNPAASGLLAALGTSMGQALGGQAAAANAFGAQGVHDLQNTQAKIKAGQSAAAAKYLDGLKQEAFSVAQARQNNALANAQFGNTVANDQAQNAVAAANAATSAQNAATRQASTSQAAADKAAAAKAKKAAADKANARAAVNHMESMVRSMLAASVPGPTTTDANGNVTHTTRPQYTQEAVRKAAVVYLVRQGGYSQANARKIVLQMFPFLPKPPPDFTGITPPPPSHPGPQVTP